MMEPPSPSDKKFEGSGWHITRKTKTFRKEDF